MIENSFFHRFKNKKILILAPHPDDEINIAGSVIYGAVQAGAQVFVVYATNGDYEYKIQVRLKEAIRALKILGVPENNIIFMGYGDTLNNINHRVHIFYSKDKPVVSNAQRTETYGLNEHPEYIYYKKKIHHSYCRNNYCKDLKNIIVSLRAEYIFAVDFDWHADHRMLSLSFEEVMGEILQSTNNTYFPTIYKTFAYCTAYESVDDFYTVNILSTTYPPRKNSEEDGSILDIFIYEWKNRVRFPVPKKCCEIFFHKNILFWSLCCHKSQSAGLHAGQIINGDKVYWLRRTDSLSYQSEVKSSSKIDTAKNLINFKLVNTTDIDLLHTNLSEYCWIPECNDKDKTVTFLWKDFQDISYIRIFGNIEKNSCVRKIKIIFDTGYFCCVGPLPLNGIPLECRIPLQKTKQCIIQIIEYDGRNAGLVECEFYSKYDTGEIPFIKIMVQNQFIYKYMIDKNISILPLQVYRYATDDSVHFEILGSSKSYIKDQILYIDKSENIIFIRACLIHNPDIYDEVAVYKVSRWRKVFLQIKKRYERFYVRKRIRKAARNISRNHECFN